MVIGTTLYVKDRRQWRAWLAKHHKTALERIAHVFDQNSDMQRKLEWRIPQDILAAIKRGRATWKHFQTFPESYKRIRIGWIDAGRRRPEVFRQRLQHFLKMTAQNKRFGMVQ
jgi:hypothetical protein